MALDPDPYRTLGLKRGATLDDVKRAYRRLAKINHPDAAGEAALPRFLAILRGPRAKNESAPASGMAIKIEDGDASDRGTWAATVEALRQAGVLDGGALRDLARYHRPTILDPHGRVGAETIAEFELAPVGELIG